MSVDIRCPICGSDTVIRTAKKGPNTGQKLYVCTRYPECKGKLPISEQIYAEVRLETMSVRKISSVDELFPALYHIGKNKNFLPTNLKGWVNVLGLYVQTGLVRRWEYLAAGGKYKRYFYATCEFTLHGNEDSEIMASTITGDFSHWQLKGFDKKIWEERFAHLVEPTCEIVWYLDDKKEQSIPKLKKTVNHFKSTGEWISLYDNQCISCGRSVSWWNYFNCNPCPYCGDKIRD